MGQPIDKITLRGFKSVHSLDNFELKPINVLIGANGSGKSNFVSFFALLRELVEGRLEKAVNKAGGSDVHLYRGPKITNEIEADLLFGNNAYQFELEPTADERLIFSDEKIEYFAPEGAVTASTLLSLGTGHKESKLRSYSGRNEAVAEYVYDAVSSWTVYHFHDTSETAAMRRSGTIRDDERLLPDAGNLAAFLYRLREGTDESAYRLIVESVKLVAPFFKDFLLRPRKKQDDTFIQLEWQQLGCDKPFLASQLSDGTLRFIALATALLQPRPPATILIDEPELGLHPYAIDVLANLILQAESRTQLVISTQSPHLLNAFEPEQIVIVERVEGESVFRRLAQHDLDQWITDYSLGELWQKNIYGGVPTHE